jgi:hypothetical protein
VDKKDVFYGLQSLARENYLPEIMGYFAKISNNQDLIFIEKLALQTQIVLKRSEPNYNHGFLLFNQLTNYISRNKKSDTILILDVGTARGFSSIVMSYVIDKLGVCGTILTIDKTSHERKTKWKSILDGNSGISRAEIFKMYKETKKIIFLQGKSKNVLKGTFLPRVNFAFLDGAHNWSSLRHEIDYLASRQVKGDIIVFDDYTPEVYPGVVKAVNYLKHTYEIKILGNIKIRGYAILTRI